MAFELERVLYETEDFLRRAIGSSTAREARKRRARRKFQEALRRMKRAAFILAGLLAALVAVGILIGGIGFLTWLTAIPTVFLIALLSLFWGGGGPRAEAVSEAAGQALPLTEVARRAEESLLDRYDALPGRALPAADKVIARLAELQPCLAELDPVSMLAGDARRLLGQHLPRLVACYLDLPPSARAAAAESTQRFTDSLDIVAGELDHLIEQTSCERRMSFDTQRRFIETRYRDSDELTRE